LYFFLATNGQLIVCLPRSGVWLTQMCAVFEVLNKIKYKCP